MNAQVIYDRPSNNPILFKKSTLGTATGILVGGYRGQIILSSPPLSTLGTLPEPGGFRKGVLHLVHPRHDDELMVWGQQVSSGGESYIYKYLVEFEVPKTKQRARAAIGVIEADLDSWFAILREWVEVLTSQDLGVDESVNSIQSSGNFVWSWSARTIARSTTAATMTINVTLPNFNTAINRANWKLAIEHANTGEHPPYEHLMLRDARARFNRRQYSYSVIYAAVASEAVLKKRLEDKLITEGRTRRLIDSILNNTLGKVLDDCEALGISFPSNTRADLVSPRNKVMHKNELVTREQAKQCLDVAVTIVNSGISL